MLDRLSRFYFNKGLRNAKEGMISSAVEDLRKSLYYNRNNTWSWKLLGLCFYRLGKLTAAEYCWTRCVGDGETDSLAEEYIKEVRMTAIKIKPYLKALFQLSLQKKYKKASNILREDIIPVLNSQVDIFNFLGVLFILLGWKRKALKEWKKALQLDSSGITAVKYIACSEVQECIKRKA